ncbi:MAG TPA: GH25 family lysozyme [Lacipirellulaceae bacterium]|nr:GH25 family lysozyme [Lacipirellulaceae bacterium]
MTHAQRVFGLDTSSAANTNVSQAQWNAAYTSGWAAAGIPSFQFAFVRSNHGIPATGGTDDPQVWQNIARATNAGMLVGTYNYDDADSNTGAVEANYYINRVGMYMKPGYLLPVLDLEAGSGQSQAALSQWCLDYINTMFAAKGINPIVYTNSSYNNDEVSATVAFTSTAGSPHTGNRTYQWLARPSGSLTTGQPGAAAGYPDPYGGWDPNFTTKSASIDPAVKPWAFWQNGTASIDPSGSSSQQFKIDFDAANGNIEYVKDFLVPALWTNAGSGDWSTISNWNSDNPGYVAGNVNTGPAPRLPNNSSLDWVKLQNSGGGTVTISSGAQTVRKFYTQQPVNITGGSLSVNYIPGSGGQFDVPSEFNNTVTLSSGASYSAHTTQVDAGKTFNINGGTVTFRSINLASNASNPGKIVMGGDVTFAPSTLGGTGTAVIQSTGTLAQAGTVEMGAASRTFTISNGAPAVDVAIQAAVTGTGGLVKAGAGTLKLAASNTYTGGTTVSNGTLTITKDSNLGAAPAGVQAANITLDGGTLESGSEITGLSLSTVGSGYTSFPTVLFGGAGPEGIAPAANVLGKITSIQVTAAGSGYTGTAAVVLVGGGGTGATAVATMALDSTGMTNKVTGITITNQDSGYTSVPAVYVTDGSGQGVAGTGAAGSVNGVTLTGIALSSPGFDYAAPTVTLSGGGGNGATAAASSSPVLTLNNNRGISLTANGGTLAQTAGATLVVKAPISSTGSGSLTKSGPGMLVIGGTNSYTGGTVVSAGVLTVSGASATLGTGNVTVQGTTFGTALAIENGVGSAIDDSATLSLLGGGVAGVTDQGYANLGAGVNEVVQALSLGGVPQSPGTYGATGSGAGHTSDEFFAGAGLISVVSLAGDFNVDGIIDMADYVLWRASVGQPAGTLVNDTTGAAVGDDQYNLWRSNFGNQLAGGSGSQVSGAAVPEPSSMGLIILGLTVMASRRRGR